MTTYTSRLAYQYDVLPNLGERQQEVLMLIVRDFDRDWTNTEIAEELEKPINTITPRVKELRDKGLLIESTKRTCGVTRRLVSAWKATPPSELFEL